MLLLWPGAGHDEDSFALDETVVAISGWGQVPIANHVHKDLVNGEAFGFRQPG